MTTLSEVFRSYGPAYLEKYGGRMPAVQKKAMATIMACRTGELGWAVFIRRFLQPVLPSGFRKVRHYGFLSAASSTDGEEIRELIGEYYEGFAEELAAEESEEAGAASAPVCPQCGKPMRFQSLVLPEARDAMLIEDTG